MLNLVQMLEPRAWRMSMIAALLFTASALFAYVVWPTFQEFRAANRTYDVLQDAVSNGDRLSSEIASLRDVVGAMTKELRGDEADLPRNHLEGFVVGRMQSISWRHNVELRSIRPGEGSRVSVFDEVLFDVEVAGNYFEIYAWLEDLSRELGFVVVRHFNMKPLRSSVGSTKLVALFTMVAYREAEELGG